MIEKRGHRRLAVLVAVGAIAASTAGAEPPPTAHVPGLGGPVPRGVGQAVELPPVAPTPKRIDGRISDWRGRPTGFAGTSIYSRGELIYQDHIFDAYGAANATDSMVFRAFDSSGAENVDPGLHRPTVTLYTFARGSETYHYGAADSDQYSDDLLELRIARDRGRICFLARTIALHRSDRTGLLVLADTRPGSVTLRVPFGAGIQTRTADVAMLLSAGGARVADLRSGQITELPPRDVAANPSGFVNAIEAAVPEGLLAGPGHEIRIAAATGSLGPDGSFTELPGLPGAPRLANVAFRPNEPVTPAFDRDQALALHDRTIDPFFATVDLGRLGAGTTQRYVPGPGYHARTFRVPSQVADEFANRGIHREYGVYLPSDYRPGEPRPLTTFLHGTSTESGATNHGYAALLPGLFRDFGEGAGSIVVLPNDRQPRTPDSTQGTEVGFGDFTGESLVELETVWRDALATFPVDRNRQYLTGYSQGGYAAYLLPPLMPDRFAGVLSIAGQVSSGDYIGVDFPGCDKLGPPDKPGLPVAPQVQHGDPCYPTSRPNQVYGPGYEEYGERHPDPRATNALKVTGSLLHVPYVMYSPAEDENQIYTNNLSAARRFAELGYRFRLYTFLAAEHQTPGILDEWTEAARYLTSFRRDPNPAEVRFVRDMPLEREVELGTAKRPNPNVHFDFGSAYWVRDLTPADSVQGRATVDARSLALPDPRHRTVVEAAGPTAPGQTGPFLMTGLSWEQGKAVSATANAFDATLTGAQRVGLVLRRMAIDTGRRISGRVRSDERLTLGLEGGWARSPQVEIDGRPAAAPLAGGTLELELPRGESTVVVSPR